MRLLEPLTPDPRAPLARANPLAKLAAALLLVIVLFASLDAVTAGIVLAGGVALIPATGLDPSSLARRAWLIGVMAVVIAVLNAAFAAVQLGPTIVDLGPMSIGSESLAQGLALGLRLLAIGLTGLLATATTQPMDLADALVVQLRVSPRFAVGALAAFRLLPALARDWQTAALARRARGVDAGRTPASAARLFGGLVMSLLVGAVRRGSRMALAMESRGFGSRPCRTIYRRPRMRGGDWALIAGAAVLGATAVAVSVLLGTWRPLFG